MRSKVRFVTKASKGVIIDKRLRPLRGDVDANNWSISCSMARRTDFSPFIENVIPNILNFKRHFPFGEARRLLLNVLDRG